MFSVICFFASACSHKGENTAPSGKLQFMITPKDLIGFAEVTTNSIPSGTNATFIIHLQFTNAKSDEFRKFTREHINQQVQLLVGSKVVAEPFIVAEISNGQEDLKFASPDEAHMVANLLGKTFFENYGYQKIDVRAPPKIYVDP